MKKKCLFIALVSLFLVSALVATSVYLLLKPDFILRKEPQAAYSLSFDDTYVKSWYDARPLFKKYDVKATFFITLPHKFTAEEQAMLAALAADGHEIASHAFTHKNASAFVKQKGMSAYISSEIAPSIKALASLGHQPVTFAYPYGARSRFIDLELKKYFYLLRGDAWKLEGKGIDELDRIYYTYSGSKIVFGLGVDNGSNVTTDDLVQGFKRAKDRREAIVIYAHSIDSTSGKYSITPERLESILAAAQEQGLVSVRFKDLVL